MNTSFWPSKHDSKRDLHFLTKRSKTYLRLIRAMKKAIVQQVQGAVRDQPVPLHLPKSDTSTYQNNMALIWSIVYLLYI